MTTQKEHAVKMSREQKLEHQKNMALPVNKFLNMVQEDGKTLKYPVAAKLRQYWINNPDPVLDDLRMANALLHELRWRKTQATKFLQQYHSQEEVTMVDDKGRPMARDECFLAHISHTMNQHLALSKMREHITTRLLAKCDGVLFTFEQFNEFVLQYEEKVKELGFELFPTTIQAPAPQ